MSFEKMQMLEDLRETLNDLYDQLHAKNTAELQKYVSQIKSDFINYFEEKHFAISKDDLNIIASYKSIKVILSEQDPKKSYMGVLYRFGLTMQLPDKKDYSFFINPTCSDNRSSSSLHIDRDESLDEQIICVEKQITALKMEITRFKPTEYSLFLKHEQSQRNTIIDIKKFSGIIELIESLINK